MAAWTQSGTEMARENAGSGPAEWSVAGWRAVKQSAATVRVIMALVAHWCPATAVVTMGYVGFPAGDCLMSTKCPAWPRSLLQLPGSNPSAAISYQAPASVRLAY